MKTVKLLSASILGYFSLISGQHLQLYLFVFAAMLLDYVTGVFVAGQHGVLSSKKATRGLYKKVGFLLLLTFGFFLDQVIPYFAKSGLGIDFGGAFSIGLMLAAWIVLTEALSILENFVNLGIPVPTYITKLLQVARQELDQRAPKESSPGGTPTAAIAPKKTNESEGASNENHT